MLFLQRFLILTPPISPEVVSLPEAIFLPPTLSQFYYLWFFRCPRISDVCHHMYWGRSQQELPIRMGRRIWCLSPSLWHHILWAWLWAMHFQHWSLLWVCLVWAQCYLLPKHSICCWGHHVPLGIQVQWEGQPWCWRSCPHRQHCKSLISSPLFLHPMSNIFRLKFGIVYG